MNGLTSRFIESEDARRHAPNILAAQLDILYGQIPTLLTIDATFSLAAMIFISWHETWLARFAWLFALFVTLILRAGAYAAYRRMGSDKDVRKLGILATGSFTLSGLLWGAFFAAMFLAPPRAFADHVYIFLFLGGLGVAAVTALSVYLPVFIGFFLPPMLLLSGISLGLGGIQNGVLGAVGVVYAAALAMFARMKTTSLMESLALRFQLGEQRDAAERANIAKSKFLAAASHDLRQPLHALTLLTSALNESTESPRNRNIVVDIKTVVGSLEKLFDALLDISRLDAGVLHPNVRHFDVAVLVNRLTGEYAPAAQTKGLKLIADPCALVVRSDPTLLERILRNYLSNAIRYTEAGEIYIACVSVQDGVRIEVSDTGVGIPLSQQTEIFSEFFQIGNPERDRTKGLGLGLAIVRRIAELLHHPISVESTPGRGSRFTVTVPKGDSALALEASKEELDTPFDLTGLCVAVIDDDADARGGTGTLLSLWGCDVIVADSEDSAVAELRERGATPAALLVDYRLRDHRTGVQAIERLRREFDREIPALLISGDTAPERLREVAASGYMMAHKPVQPAALRAFLHSVRLDRAS